MKYCKTCHYYTHGSCTLFTAPDGAPLRTTESSRCDSHETIQETPGDDAVSNLNWSWSDKLYDLLSGTGCWNLDTDGGNSYVYFKYAPERSAPEVESGYKPSAPAWFIERIPAKIDALIEWHRSQISHLYEIKGKMIECRDEFRIAKSGQSKDEVPDGME